MNEIITLIGAKSDTNAAGDEIQTETRTDVFAKIKSVGASYKLQALAVGLRPKYRLVLQDVYDYDGQERVEYNGKLYRVIDTYRGEDQSIELTVSEA